MSNEYSRAQRVGDFLQRQLAVLVQRLADPRLEIVSVTAVNISSDLNHAKVYFTMLACESEKDIEDATSVLNGATGFLRKELSKTTSLRNLPRINFYFDSSISRARDLDRLIREAN